MFSVRDFEPEITTNDTARVYFIQVVHVLVLLIIAVDCIIMYYQSLAWHKWMLAFEILVLFLAWAFRGCVLSIGEHRLLQKYKPDLPHDTFTKGLGSRIGINWSEHTWAVIMGVVMTYVVLAHSGFLAFSWWKKQQQKKKH